MLIAVMASGCGGGDARIAFSVPQSLASLARSVRVRVVRPTVGDAVLDCDAVAFGEVTAERLDGATEREVVLDAGGPTELGELVRNARTLLVAEAFDAAAALGGRVAAGCADRDAIDAGDDVRIEGVPAVDLVGVDPSLATGISVPAGDVPNPLTLVANDARGVAVANIAVRLQVLDVSGAPLVIEQTGDSAGAVAVATDFLAARPVGAVRLRLQAPWQRTPLSIDTASPPHELSATIDGGVISLVPVSGTNTIYAAMTADIGEAALVRITADAGALTIGAAAALPTDFRMLVRVPTATSELVAGLWGNSTYRVLNTTSGTFGAPSPLAVGLLSGADTTLWLPSCGAASPPLTLIDPSAEGSPLLALEALDAGVILAQVPAFVGTDDLVLRAAGCIADEAGGLHRAVAVGTAAAEELRIEGVGQALLLPASSSAMRLGTASDPRLLVGLQTTSGPQVRSYRLGGSPAARRLEQQGAVAVAGSPERLVAVDLDGNPELDFVALVSAGTPAFAVVYQGIDVQPSLSALFVLPATDGTPGPRPDLAAAAGTFPFDSDGDGRVELWSFQGYLDSVVVGGPAPPAPPVSLTLVHRLDFAR